MNGNCKIGWFLGHGSVLHGYGKDYSKEQDGLFENNTFRFNDYDVTTYNVDQDIIAEKILFDLTNKSKLKPTMGQTIHKIFDDSIFAN